MTVLVTFWTARHDRALAWAEDQAGEDADLDELARGMAHWLAWDAWRTREQRWDRRLWRWCRALARPAGTVDPNAYRRAT